MTPAESNHQGVQSTFCKTQKKLAGYSLKTALQLEDLTADDRKGQKACH